MAKSLIFSCLPTHGVELRESVRWRSVFCFPHLALAPASNSPGPARHALTGQGVPFGPSLFASPDALARDSLGARRFDLFGAQRPQPAQQLASPPRIAAALRAGSPSPHLIVILYHVLLYLPVFTFNRVRISPDLFSSSRSAFRVIVRHRYGRINVGW